MSNSNLSQGTNRPLTPEAMGGRLPNGKHEDPAGDLMERVVQGAHDTIDRIAETAAPHVQSLQSGISDANEMLHQRARQVRKTGEEWTQSLRSTVRNQPLAAVAAALVLGMLISRITR